MRGARRSELVQDGADGGDDLDVGHLAVAADVVGFSHDAALEYQGDRLAVIAHIEPVAHVAPVTVDRKRLAPQGVENHQRNQLLGKLVRAVVVGAVGGQRGQAIGVPVGAHQMIAGRLGCRVGAVGLIRMRFGEGRIGRAQRAVNLVGRDMEEAEAGLGFRRSFGRSFGRKRAVIAQRLVQQVVGAHDVGRDKLPGIDDRAVHVALGGKVDHCVGLVSHQQPADQGGVLDATLHKDVSGMRADRGEVAEIAGIGELVERDHAIAGGDALEDKVGADKAGTAGNQNRARHVETSGPEWDD